MDKYVTFYNELKNEFLNYKIEDLSDIDQQWFFQLQAVPALYKVLLDIELDTTLTSEQKIDIHKAIEYFHSPLDIIPEAFLGIGGYLDDIIVAAIGIRRFVDLGGDVSMIAWSGAQTLLNTVDGIIGSSEEMVGKEVLFEISQVIGS